MTASWSAGRTFLIASFVRVGYTRFVSNATYTSFSGSIQSDVPVNPVWPKARADIRVPHDEVGSIVSQPSARELPGISVGRFVRRRFSSVAQADRAGARPASTCMK